MITLEEACETYTKGEQTAADAGDREAFPILSITESDTEWAFFPATDGGCYGAYINVVNKETGELTKKNRFFYNQLPQVAIPKGYIKDAPKKNYEDPFDDLFGDGFFAKYIAPTQT